MLRESLHLWIDLIADTGERIKPALLPDEAERHFCTAYAESLKGIRAMLDVEIGRAEARGTTSLDTGSAVKGTRPAESKRQRDVAGSSASRSIPIEDSNEIGEYSP